MIFETSAFPVPPADWYMFSTQAQAQQVFALVQKNFPNAHLQLVDGSLDGEAIFFMPPRPEPSRDHCLVDQRNGAGAEWRQS